MNLEIFARAVPFPEVLTRPFLFRQRGRPARIDREGDDRAVTEGFPRKDERKLDCFFAALICAEILLKALRVV